MKLVCFDKEVRISSIQRKLLLGKHFAKIYILKIFKNILKIYILKIHQVGWILFNARNLESLNWNNIKIIVLTEKENWIDRSKTECKSLFVNFGNF